MACKRSLQFWEGPVPNIRPSGYRMKSPGRTQQASKAPPTPWLQVSKAPTSNFFTSVLSPDIGFHSKQQTQFLHTKATTTCFSPWPCRGLTMPHPEDTPEMAMQGTDHILREDHTGHGHIGDRPHPTLTKDHTGDQLHPTLTEDT